MNEPQKHYVIWEKDTKNSIFMWFHLHEIPTKGKSIQTESVCLRLEVGEGLNAHIYKRIVMNGNLKLGGLFKFIKTHWTQWVNLMVCKFYGSVIVHWMDVSHFIIHSSIYRLLDYCLFTTMQTVLLWTLGVQVFIWVPVHSSLRVYT